MDKWTDLKYQLSQFPEKWIAVKDGLARANLIALIAISLACGFLLFMVAQTALLYLRNLKISREVMDYKVVTGMIESISISEASDEGNQLVTTWYIIQPTILYVVEGKEFRYTLPIGDTEKLNFNTKEELWAALSALAPGQAVSVSRTNLDLIKFLSQTGLSSLKTPVKVRYSPSHPEWNDWMLKDIGSNRLVDPVITLCFTSILLGILLYILPHQSLARQSLSLLIILGVLLLGLWFWSHARGQGAAGPKKKTTDEITIDENFNLGMLEGK